MTKPIVRITWAHILLGVVAWAAAFACGFGGYLAWRLW